MKGIDPRAILDLGADEEYETFDTMEFDCEVGVKRSNNNAERHCGHHAK
jgi:hypothetical protein